MIPRVAVYVERLGFFVKDIILLLGKNLQTIPQNIDFQWSLKDKAVIYTLMESEMKFLEHI